MRTRTRQSRRRARTKRGEQLLLDWKEHGGPRKGAGRKRTVHSRVEHRRRGVLKARHPIHVTSRLVHGLPSLRTPREKELILQVFRDKCEREGWRLVHFSIQSNHLHLIAEAEDRASFTRGLRGLLISLGKRLNRLWRRTGRVLERFHEQVVKCPTELRHVLRYVLGNSRKHELERTGKSTIPALSDPHSSAPWFEELLDPYEDFPPGKPPIASPRTWLLRLGWRRAGPLDSHR